MTTRQTSRRATWAFVFSILAPFLVPFPAQEAHGNETPLHYVLMQEDLAPLKTDFNAAVDQVRLVFIVGPT